MSNKEDLQEQEEEQSISQNEQVTEENVDAAQPPLEDDLQVKLAELNDKYLRLYSDFDNFRKRTAKEKIELIQSGGEDVFKSLLPIIDDFDRAVKSNADAEDIAAVKEGISLIYNKLQNTLFQKGLKEQESLGEVFDTDLHEAITNIPAPDEASKGKILDVLEKGYTLNGKVIRYAKVVIGN